MDEYRKFRQGELLVNNTTHAVATNSRSSAKGFCFSEDIPEVAFRYLSGVVDLDICMVLDIPKEYLNPAHGVYKDPDCECNGEITTMIKSEWCCETYDNKIAKLVFATNYYSLIGISHRDIDKLIKRMCANEK